jgi:hypothetical protein
MPLLENAPSPKDNLLRKPKSVLFCRGIGGWIVV